MAGFLSVDDMMNLTEAGIRVVGKSFATNASVAAEGQRAEGAAVAHTNTQVALDRARLGGAESALGDHAGRLAQLEALGGLAPGDVSDATVAAIFANDSSEASGVVDNRVRPMIATRVGASPEDFGAVGDGVTDDSAAVQAALTAAVTIGVLNLTRTYFMGDTTVTAVLTRPLAIRGGGTAVWNSGSGIRLTQNNADHTVSVDGLSLYTHAKGTGVALEIIGSAQNAGTGLQPRTKHRGSIANVNIRGIRDTGINGWGKGIRLVDIMNFMITRVHIDGYQPNQGNFVSTHGIEMVTDPTVAKAVDVVISQTYVYLVQFALDVQGYEGVSVDQSFFIGVGTGFLFDPVDAGAPLVTFTNGQIAFQKFGLDFRRSHQSIVSDSLIYTHSTSGLPATATGVSLTDVTTTRITGCTFVANNGMQTGVLIQGALSKRNTVESCTFYSSITNPVKLTSNTADNTVRDLTIANPASQSIINEAGTANRVEGSVHSFYGAPPIEQPKLPPSPTLQNVVEALLALGLVGQS